MVAMSVDEKVVSLAVLKAVYLVVLWVDWWEHSKVEQKGVC